MGGGLLPTMQFQPSARVRLSSLWEHFFWSLQDREERGHAHSEPKSRKGGVRTGSTVAGAQKGLNTDTLSWEEKAQPRPTF